MDISSLIRQLGLAARGSAEGAAVLPSMLWNGPVDTVNWAAGMRIPRADIGPALDALGLPQPENSTERVAQDVVGALSAGGGALSLARRGAEFAADPAARAMAALFAQAPVAQLASTGISAGAAGTARENGASQPEQALIGILAGLAPVVPAAVGARGAFSSKLAQTGEGEFGPLYGNLTGDPENAVAHLLNTRTGEVPAAATHPHAGPIDLVAGDAKSGLAHIEAQGRDDVLRALPSLLREGTWYSRPSSGPGRTYLGDDQREAVVRMDWDGRAKQWMPTAYDRGPGNKYPLETGRTTNRANPGPGLSSPGHQAGDASIGDPHDPRQYVGLLSPEEAAARRAALAQRLRDALFGGTLGVSVGQ